MEKAYEVYSITSVYEAQYCTWMIASRPCIVPAMKCVPMLQLFRKYIRVVYWLLVSTVLELVWSLTYRLPECFRQLIICNGHLLEERSHVFILQC